MEWCRTRARAHRWEEECLLLSEEMRRTAEFFLWDANRWVERRKASMEMPTSDRRVSLGRMAYAHKQAQIRFDLAEQAVNNFAILRSQLDVQSTGASGAVI